MDNGLISYSQSYNFTNKKIVDNDVPKGVVNISGEFKPYNVYTSFDAITSSVEALYEHVTRGKAFNPCVFMSNYLNRAKFMSTQMIVIDIDDNPIGTLDNNGKEKATQTQPVTKQKLLEVSKGLGLTPNIIYPSASYTDEHPRWRVIYVFNRDWRHADGLEGNKLARMKVKWMYENEYGIILDNASTNPTQFYYGSAYSLTNNRDDLLHLDTTLNNMSALETMRFPQKGEREVQAIYKRLQMLRTFKPSDETPTTRRMIMYADIVSAFPRDNSMPKAEWMVAFYAFRNFARHNVALEMLIEHYKGSVHEKDEQDIRNKWAMTTEGGDMVGLPKLESILRKYDPSFSLTKYDPSITYAPSPTHIINQKYLCKVDPETDKYIPDLEQLGGKLPDTKFVFIKAPCGSAKSTLMKYYAENASDDEIVRIYAHRLSITRQMSERFDGFSVITSDAKLKRVTNKTIATPRSAVKHITKHESNWMFVDECDQLVQDMRPNGNYTTPELSRRMFDFFIEQMKGAKKVVMFDATMTNIVVDMVIELFGEENVSVVYDEYHKHVPAPTLTMMTSRSSWATKFVDEYIAGKKIIAFMDVRKMNNILVSWITYRINKHNATLPDSQKIKMPEFLVINSVTKAKENDKSGEVNEFLRDADGYLSMRTRILGEDAPPLVIVSSPTMSTGFDIQHEFDSVFIGCFGVLSGNDSLQMFMRVRNAKDRYVFVDSANKNGVIDSYEDLVNHYKSSVTGFDPHSLHSRTFLRYSILQYSSKMELRYYVRAFAESYGFNIVWDEGIEADDVEYKNAVKAFTAEYLVEAIEFYENAYNTKSYTMVELDRALESISEEDKKAIEAIRKGEEYKPKYSLMTPQQFDYALHRLRVTEAFGEPEDLADFVIMSEYYKEGLHVTHLRVLAMASCGAYNLCERLDKICGTGMGAPEYSEQYKALRFMLAQLYGEVRLPREGEYLGDTGAFPNVINYFKALQVAFHAHKYGDACRASTQTSSFEGVKEIFEKLGYRFKTEQQKRVRKNKKGKVIGVDNGRRSYRMRLYDHQFIGDVKSNPARAKGREQVNVMVLEEGFGSRIARYCDHICSKLSEEDRAAGEEDRERMEQRILMDSITATMFAGLTPDDE